MITLATPSLTSISKPTAFSTAQFFKTYFQTPNSKSVVFCETDPEGSDEAPSMPGSPHPILGRNFRPGRSPKIKDISAISPVVEERALASFEWNQCAGDTYSRGSPHPILGRGHRPRQKRCRPESYSKGRNEISKLFAKIEEHEMVTYNIKFAK